MSSQRELSRDERWAINLYLAVVAVPAIAFALIVGATIYVNAKHGNIRNLALIALTIVSIIIGFGFMLSIGGDTDE